MAGGPGVDGGVDARERERRKKIQQIVAQLYRRTGLPHCCDPRTLAEAIGLRVRPANCDVAHIAEGILRFPNRAHLRIRGKGIYEAIARYLLVLEGESSERDAVRMAALELALPKETLRSCRLADLAKVQPNYPVDELENALMSLHGSCVMRRISLG